MIAALRRIRRLRDRQAGREFAVMLAAMMTWTMMLVMVVVVMMGMNAR